MTYSLFYIDLFNACRVGGEKKRKEKTFTIEALIKCIHISVIKSKVNIRNRKRK
jgi:hypothetical protein